ncbi:von Willebrand factor A domain-containing protein 7-like [Palaemon carinicauda]|uniref:von Willebrand factor A domain-containing protein 7-like n=1 Tax=Palaemon carinicauda TaxID=392227 RepID=UPI0035B68E52
MTGVSIKLVMAQTPLVAAGLAIVLLANLGRTSGFLATPLNASDPDIVNILCPDQTTGITRDHKWITREAVRRNIRQFFIDFPPPSKPDFNIPTTASLTELFHAYYGDEVSAARFIRAVNSIAAANVKGDSASQFRYDPSVQADAEGFDGLHSTMSQRYPQIMTSIVIDESYPAARSLLGLTLHSLQKFYSHSTWIEQGNTGILEDLGLPGFTGFDHTAAPEEDVCTPCTDAQGPCSGNVISGAGLTSGYYTYVDSKAEGIIVDKPKTGGKCSHGGVLDDSASAPAEGGINKDTASPCFSPHYYLHEQAAELAVQATDYYLSVILDAVGVEKYRSLFDLYFGSALSITVDTTASMGKDIAAVKKQVAQIVDNTQANLFVLVPFNDPVVGPVTRTSDPKEFMDAVNTLEAHLGGDVPEMYWSALQLALSNTPDFGDIFCFTDAPAKDGELMEGNIAIAQQREIKVTTIYSETMSYENKLITDIADYQRLADITGGLFIPSDKFDIDAIVPIIGEGVESANVDIIILKNITGNQQINIPIDDSVFDFELRVTGVLTHGKLTDPTGKVFDLRHQGSLESDPDVEIVVYTDGFRAIGFHNLHYGMWRLDVTSLHSYDVLVTGNSTLNWLGGFSILDPSPPHPHYMDIDGRPLTNTVYYLDVMLIGYLESYVEDVNRVEYTDGTGVTLRTIDYNGEIDDEFYIRSEPLPEQPFYVKLYGHVHSGNVFCRYLPVMMVPVTASVEVLAKTEELSALPGYNSQADFLVTNYGLESEFDITGNDDKGYLTMIAPPRVYIVTNGTATVTVYFHVDFMEIPGTVSTVTVTAQSLKQTRSVNSAVTQFYVLSEDDLDPPTCILEGEPDCSGFTYNGICDQKNWTAVATLQDKGSGLSAAYVKPNGFSTDLESFSPGTIDPVQVSHVSTCCSPQSEFIGVDSVGNVGKCKIDMGDVGGYILDFEAIDAGTTWIYLRWTLSPTIYKIHKYSLLIDEDLTSEFPCPDPTCYYNATYLDPCAKHTFHLTPHFYIETLDRAGAPAFVGANTLDIEPSPPENGVVVNTTESSATIAWEVVGTECVSKFKVCYRNYGVDPTQICKNTVDPTLLMPDLEACAAYEIIVQSIGLSGKPSTPLKFYLNTDEALPGAPKNVEAVMTTIDMVTINWDDPEDHAQCVDLYKKAESDSSEVSVTFDALNDARQLEINQSIEVLKERPVQSADHSMTIYPLDPCTGYIFKVAAVSRSGLIGPFALREARTLEGDPGPVYSLGLSLETIDSIKVQWESPTACLDHYKVCYFDEEEVGEVCQDVHDTEIILSELYACTEYYVSVALVTPSGIIGNKTWANTRTLDLAPGEPTNVAIVKVTSHSIDIRYDPPDVNPQCTIEYDFEIIDKSSNQITAANEKLVGLDNIFQHLEACTLYEARVRAVSRTSLHSDWAIVSAVTKEDIPSAPQNFEAASVTSNTVNLVWFRPAVNDRCIGEYYLEWSDGSQSIDGPLKFEMEATVTSLTSCTDYAFSLNAMTPEGTSGEVATLTVKTSC